MIVKLYIQTWKLLTHLEICWKWFHILNPLYIIYDMNMFPATYTLGAGGATSPVSVCVMCYVSCVRCGGRVSTRTAPADSGPGPVLHHNTTTHINNNKPHVRETHVLLGTCRIKLIRGSSRFKPSGCMYIAHPKSLISSNRILYSKLNCKTLL